MQHWFEIHRELKADTSNHYKKLKVQSLRIYLKLIKKKQKTSPELRANSQFFNQRIIRNTKYNCRVTMK